MTNSADLDQLEKPTFLDLHYLETQGTSEFSRTRANKLFTIWRVYYLMRIFL